MSKCDPDTPFDEADVLIIAGLCLGMSQEAAGNWVATPAFPAGVSDRTVRNRIAAQREAYDRLIGRISIAFKKKEEEFEELTKSQYREKLEKLRAKGLRAKETALDQAIQNPTDVQMLALGVKVAESLEDRDFGKAKQVIENSGEVSHHHLLWTPQTRAELLAQEHDMIGSEDLLKALPGEVLEAEVVIDA